MKKLPFLFALGLLLQGCFDNFEIEDNARLQVTGSVTMPNNASAGNIDVALFDENRVLNSATTTSNGTYNFISLRSNAPEYDLIINNVSSEAFTKPVFKIFDTETTNIDAPNVTLESKARLDLSLRRTSNTTENLLWELTYTSDRCIIFLDSPNPENTDSLELEGCYETESFTGTISSNDDMVTDRNVLTILGSEATLTYQLGNQAPETINIPINSTTTSYVLEY